MHLKNIHLTQFKNFSSVQIALSPEINCFLGNNGSGKTNLLDSVHYLCLTKSAVNAIDLQNIMHGHSFFAIKGEFQKKAKSVEIKCIVEAGKKKQLINNGKAYDKMSEHVGELPVVLMTARDAPGPLLAEGLQCLACLGVEIQHEQRSRPVHGLLRGLCGLHSRARRGDRHAGHRGECSGKDRRDWPQGGGEAGCNGL